MISSYEAPSTHDTRLHHKQIAIIGAGTMGRAITTGIVRAKLLSAADIAITDDIHDRALTLAEAVGARACTTNVAACTRAAIVVLCVKPRDVVTVLRELIAGGALTHRPLIVSIAAGVRIATIESVVGDAIPVVRVMPNTASVIGRGMTVICAGTHGRENDMAITHALFTPLGRCLTLDERHFDAVTALSASGPAFIYVTLDALIDGGVQCGLPRNVATVLAAQMTSGAAEMVLNTGRSPATLKDDVTTPGGCTIAGLLVLEDGRLRSVLARTVEVTARVAGGLG